MATITGRIISTDTDAMETASVTIRRVDGKPIGGLFPSGLGFITLDSEASFSVDLGKGQYLITITNTADVLDITVPSDVGTFPVSSILTNAPVVYSPVVEEENFESFIFSSSL